MDNQSRQCCICGRPPADGGYRHGNSTLCRDCHERGVARDVREMGVDLIKKEIGRGGTEGRKPQKIPKKSGRCRECGEPYNLPRLQNGLCLRCQEAEEVMSDEDWRSD